ITNGDVRPADDHVFGEEADALVIPTPARAPVDARLHELAPPRVEGRQRDDRLQRRGGEHVTIVVEHARTQAQWSDGVQWDSSPLMDASPQDALGARAAQFALSSRTRGA